MASNNVVTTVEFSKEYQTRIEAIRRRRGGSFRDFFREALRIHIDKCEAEIEDGAQKAVKAKALKKSERGGAGRFENPQIGAPLPPITQAKPDPLKPSPLDAIYESAAREILTAGDDQRVVEWLLSKACEDAKARSPLRSPPKSEIKARVKAMVIALAKRDKVKAVAVDLDDGEGE